MSNSDNKGTTIGNIPGNLVIKTEPGLITPGRLSSFRAPRDLMLNNLNANKQQPKKVFTPNLNVARNKNKHLLIIDTNKQKKNKDRNDRFDKNDRNKSGNQNKGPGVLRSTGVFSEGIAVGPRRAHLRENYSGGYSKDGQSELKKPVYKVKTEKKVEKEFEGLQIKAFMSDDDSDDECLDSQHLPIRLPLMECPGLFIPKKKDKIVTPAPEIKLESVIKTEPTDDNQTDVKPPKVEVVNCNTNLENFFPDSVVDYFQNPTSSLLMLQFPDSLPGRGPDTEGKDKNAKADETTQSPNVCTFNNLEEGQIGKIQIYKSGKVKLLIGDTHYDLSLGSLSNFRQDVISISTNQEERTGTMIHLGEVKTKFIAMPDWENLCEDDKSL